MRPFLLLAPLALIALLSLPASAQEMHQTGTIATEGHGEVQASPDTAFVTSGVTSQGATARAALDANTADMAALIATLKAAGIEARDIQTSGFSVSPNYVYSDARDANGYSLPPMINGYVVSNSVSVRVRDLGKLGMVLDQAVTVGANTINGVAFSVADPAALLIEARKAAFADARAKADLYAGEAGVRLGRIRGIGETQGYGSPQPYMMKADAATSMAAPVPVEAGELTYAINVSVIWELEQ